MNSVKCWRLMMASHLSAEMIFSTGPAAAPVAKAIGIVKGVLCKPHGSKDVYAVIFRAKHRSADHSDHLAVMHAVISAARRSWHEVSKSSVRRRVGSNTRGASAIEVIDRNGIRIYRGCASPEQFRKVFVAEEGIYLFPSHLKLNTVAQLGLDPLPSEVNTLPIVLWVGIDDKTKNIRGIAGDRGSRTWRERFFSEHQGLTATEVADEAGNTAKNRSALASRWTNERKIFGVRFQNHTLYPAFQFKDGEPVAAIADILKAMPSSFTGWDVGFFLTSPNSFLDGEPPLELLKSKPERVVSLAYAFAHPADAY